MKTYNLSHIDHENLKPGDVVISEKDISERLDEIAHQLVSDYKTKENLLVVGLLTGAAWLTTDMFSRLHKKGLCNIELSFMKVSSYPSGTDAQHEPRIDFDSLINPQQKNVLIIDDIADTGKSLAVVEKLFKSRDVRSIASFVLLDKPTRREVTYQPKYIGFTIPNIWVQGRGMDTDGIGRGEPNIIKGPYTYTNKD